MEKLFIKTVIKTECKLDNPPSCPCDSKPCEKDYLMSLSELFDEIQKERGERMFGWVRQD
jgi:hypothetical protein